MPCTALLHRRSHSLTPLPASSTTPAAVGSAPAHLVDALDLHIQHRVLGQRDAREPLDQVDRLGLGLPLHLLPLLLERGVLGVLAQRLQEYQSMGVGSGVRQRCMG